jgi:hypothetical protein
MIRSHPVWSRWAIAFPTTTDATQEASSQPARMNNQITGKRYEEGAASHMAHCD